MRNTKWFATAAAGALIVAGLVALSAPNSQAFVPAQKLSQIDPLQIMTNAKDLPTQTFEDRTFVFADRRASRWQEAASQAANP
jgi:hypothetical protein